MTREDPQLKVRLPAALKAGIEEAAKANNRSTNAEIVSRLEQTLHARGMSGTATMEFAVSEKNVDALTRLTLLLAERDWDIHMLRVQMIGLRDQFRAAVELLALTDMSENDLVKEWIESEQGLNGNVDDLDAWHSEAREKAASLVEARKAVAAQLSEQKDKKD